MNVHREDQPLNEDALAKIAVDLYQRDKENQETEGAVRGALQEMQIPDTYYEAAKAELYRRQMAKDAKRAAVQRVLHFVAPLLIVVAAVSIPSFLNLFHKP